MGVSSLIDFLWIMPMVIVIVEQINISFINKVNNESCGIMRELDRGQSRLFDSKGHRLNIMPRFRRSF